MVNCDPRPIIYFGQPSKVPTGNRIVDPLNTLIGIEVCFSVAFNNIFLKYLTTYYIILNSYNYKYKILISIII